MPEMPARMVVLWSGAIVDIPAGWYLCDGTHGTPDLRDRFVIGAGSTYAPNATGGTTQHQHTGTTDGHYHTMPGGAAIDRGAVYDETVDIKTDTFTTDLAANLPPFYALAYIMLSP